MNTQELYRLINPLSDERRIEARARARAIVTKDAGEQPNRSGFSSTAQSKYPAWMNRLIMALCVVVLAAAFAPSAIRLYAIGSTTFAAAIPHAPSATAAGVAIVLMAETAQVLFSLAAAVMHTSNAARRLLYVSMAGATILALVGNGQTSLPGHWTNPFAWLEALMPPLLVLSTAYILKEQMLSAIEQRHAAERAYQEALAAWKHATAQPERAARYMSALANSLRDAIKEDNARGAGATNRKELMSALSVDQWKALVYREIEADNWYSTPSQDDFVTPAQPPAAPQIMVQPAQALRNDPAQAEPPAAPTEQSNQDEQPGQHDQDKQPRRRRAIAQAEPVLLERPQMPAPSSNGKH